MKTQWLKTEDGRVRFPVLRQFYFNGVVPREIPGAPTRHDTICRHFSVGEHFLSPDNPQDAAVLNHRWIDEHFADGYVESPDKTAARVQAEKDVAQARAAEIERIQAETRAELDRLKATDSSQTANEAAIQAELDRPISELRGKKS